MNRKNFIKYSSILSLVNFIPPKIFAQNKIDNEIIKPNRLKIGDKIGLVAPAGFITEKELAEANQNLQTLGFEVVAGENILNRHGYLAGTDKQRADDLNKMFQNKDIKGIVCARGGYGCARMLQYLDYELIKKNPKILLGYSDITILHYAIFSQTGLITFHGPVGISTFNEFSILSLNNVLINPQPILAMWNADEDKTKTEFNITTIRSGKAKGRLIGGNLSLVVSLIGTKYDVDAKNKIIFLEEIGEEPYRIDRMLTQMIQADKFVNAAGIALGVFSKCESKPDESGISNSFTFTEVLFDRLFNLGIPVIYGLSFGHIKNKLTIPFGAMAELDVDNQIINLLESSVQ